MEWISDSLAQKKPSGNHPLTYNQHMWFFALMCLLENPLLADV